jgi:signal transduction histidine kinase
MNRTVQESCKGLVGGTMCFGKAVVCAIERTLAHRTQARQLNRELDLRFEERLKERTRIARELHDTLFQGFLSASMQLHVAMDYIPDDSASKPLVGRVLRLMQQAIDEGRTTIQGLRSVQREFPHLEHAFADVQYQLALQSATRFRIFVEGQPRQLKKSVLGDAYWIGREAIVNAYRHSEGRSIETQIEYAPNRLHLVVRDDGCGIDPELLESGRHGHWGLLGMRERAERIHARLRVLSRVRGGTEVELSVPGPLAFAEDIAA